MKKIFIYHYVLLLFVGLSVSAWAEEIPKDQTKGYIAKKESVKGVFDALSSRINKPIILSKLAARKQIGGDFDLNNPQELIEYLSNELNLIWYYDGHSVYIYDGTEISNAFISLNNASFSAVKNFLVQSHLYDKRYPLRSDEINGLFYVSGPPIYIELVTKATQFLDSQAESGAGPEKVALIKLKNTFVEDRQYQYRNQTIVIPGIARIISHLLSSNPRSTLELMTPKATEAPSNIKSLAAASASGSSTSNIDQIKLQGPSIKSIPNNNVQIVSNPNNNSLLVKGSSEQIAFVKTLVSELDQPKRHIELSVWIIDLDKNTLDQMGVDWKGGMNFKNQLGVRLNAGTSTLEGGQFIASVMALSRQKKANVVSRPMVLTQENIPAVFDNNRTFYSELLGEKNVKLENVTYGTLVSVLPRFTENNQIEMMINIEDGNEVSQSDHETKTSLPKVGRTNISTIARVPKGKSLLVGGYTRDANTSENTKIPGLGSLPLIGKLFSYENKSISSIVRVFLIQPREINAPLNRDASDLASDIIKSSSDIPLQDWVKNYLDSQS
ncbi:type III secretion system outer membrane ring subunit SctC [Candidatus Hamiltonella defensa]|uniref:type III secretion system outer membrane ring subunit SctC n=1 Tax=Candidatus Williamhamiltonella defendens TaxID=138072 RepID=UPI001583BEE8|nr:type III secretion system outer membrane ring subunit SctC [Candidatus Hamiltonella defensa]